MGADAGSAAGLGSGTGALIGPCKTNKTKRGSQAWRAEREGLGGGCAGDHGFPSRILSGSLAGRWEQAIPEGLRLFRGLSPLRGTRGCCWLLHRSGRQKRKGTSQPRVQARLGGLTPPAAGRAAFPPQLFCRCFLVYRWKQRSGSLPFIFLIAPLPAGGRQDLLLILCSAFASQHLR